MSSEKISGGSDWLLEKGVVNAIRLAAEFGKGYLIMSIFANVLQGMVPAGSVIIMPLSPENPLPGSEPV